MTGDSDPSPFEQPQPPQPGGMELAPGVFAPESAVIVRFSRASGPGGQNVNKVNTRAELSLDLQRITGLTIGAMQRLRLLAGSRINQNDELRLTGQAHRGQAANRQEVMDRLRELLVRAMVQPKRRKRSKPTASARRRRLEAKRHRSDVKANRRADSAGPTA